MMDEKSTEGLCMHAEPAHPDLRAGEGGAKKYVVIPLAA